MRPVTVIVIDGLGRDLHLRTLAQGISGVQVSGEAREVAAGNLQPDAASRLKLPTRLPDLDWDLVDPSGFDQGRIFQRFPEAGPPDPLTDVNCRSIRQHLGQDGSEIGVDGAGSGIELQLDGTGDLQLLGQGLTAIDQDVVPLLNGAAILRPSLVGRKLGLSSHGGDGIGGIVLEAVLRSAGRRS